MTGSTRRRFMLSAAALASASFIDRARAAASDSRLGVALCGLGSLSEQQIAPALLQTQHCKLAGLISDSPEKLARLGEKYGVPTRSRYGYETMDRLADNREIDIVYVVTPNALHAEHTIRSARAGKHVFCEKPMEISVERCQQMIDACRAAQRKLGVAYRCQFEPHHREAMRLAREKEFGDLKLIEARFGFPIGDPKQWRLRRALAGGGALMDVGVYALQATRYLTGEEPLSVSAMEAKTDRVKFAEVDESMVWQAQFPGGVLAHCGTSYNSAPHGRVFAAAERGWFELEPAFNYTGIRGRRSDGREIAFPEVDQFATEMDAFARSIMEDAPFRASGEEGMRDVRIMRAIYESAHTGRTIAL